MRTCPTCKKEAAKDGNPRFPFCSERCRLIDLGRWIDEEYRIPDQPDTAGGGVDGIPDPDSER
jgi:endogenous inhibitor of DNA gyrase (YacG/DUF329 family)